jgi:hypothetical protein
MTLLYMVAIAVHVVVAVLGIGLVGAVPLTARIVRRASGTLAGGTSVLGAILRALQVAFGAMVLTGVLLDVSAAGAFHRTTWFKASIVVLLVIGFSHARARAALRRGLAPGGSQATALDEVERWGWAMCAAVAVITLLMQVKPLP